MKTIKYCIECGEKLIEKEVEGTIRLTCSSNTCGYTFWDSPVPVVAAIVEYRGKVILARNRKWPEKMFGLITGFLEKGESPESGILREMEEELGLKGTIVSLVGVYSFPQMNQLIVAYHVKAEGEITLEDEIAEIKHIPFEKLRPWELGTGPAVKDWLEKHTGIKKGEKTSR
jgi:NADH pyrophosphatase NudC (nudix superfamily)